jgi:hypothetical protein
MSTQTGRLTLHVFDAERKPFQGASVLVTLTDGYARQIHRMHHDANEITFNIAVADNLRDLYTVHVAADDRRDSGFTPVLVAAGDPQDVFVMMAPKNPQLVFPATFADLSSHPEIHKLLTDSAMTDADYQTLKTSRPLALATLLNTLTALHDMPAGANTTVLTLFYKKVIWDRLKDDRFYAQVDSRLDPFLKENGDLYSKADAGLHSAEDCKDLVESTKPLGSRKQILFLESNVQFVFYKGKTAGLDLVENDMDYFKDGAAHFLLEVPARRTLEETRAPDPDRSAPGVRPSLESIKEPAVLESQSIADR